MQSLMDLQPAWFMKKKDKEEGKDAVSKYKITIWGDVCKMTPRKYFNRGDTVLDSPYIGHTVRETEDKIVILVSLVIDLMLLIQNKKVGRNVVLNMFVNELTKYNVDRDGPLPSGEPI